MIINVIDILPLVRLGKHIILFGHPRSRRTEWESPPCSTEGKEFRRDRVVKAAWAGCLIHNRVTDRLRMSSQYAFDWESVLGNFSHKDMATKCQFAPAKCLFLSFSDSSSVEATGKRSWLGRIPQTRNATQQAHAMAWTSAGGWCQNVEQFRRVVALLLFLAMLPTCERAAKGRKWNHYITDLTRM